MLEITETPPQNASPYTPAGEQEAEMPENMPKLGTPIPGTTGGLPALSGLSVGQNPLAGELMTSPEQTNNVNPNSSPNQAAPNAHPYPAPPQFAGGGAVQKAEQVRQMGRGEDSILMHVTPHEFKGLQALAMAQGGSLTINPYTGLPEAGFLGGLFKQLLPTLLGVGLNFAIPGLGIAVKGLSTAMQAGLMTGLGSFALTGSLKKGLMAGLGAYGGASLAGGIQSAVAKPPVTPGSYVTPTAPVGGGYAPSLVNIPAVPPPGVPVIPPTAASAASAVGANAVQTVPSSVFGRFAQGFAQTAKGPMTGILGKAAVPLAIAGSTQALNAFGPTGVKTSSGAIDNSYQGPYTAEERTATFAPDTQSLLSSSKERRYFDVYAPEIRNMQGQLVQPGASTAPGTPILQQFLNPKAKKGQPMYYSQYVPFMGAQPQQEVPNQFMYQPLSLQDAIGQRYPSYDPNNTSGYAEGGEVELSDGAFVLDARTVSELGNGSSNAGKEVLRKIGGRPIDGPGDGVSDSIPARIGRDQPARVARDEVVIPAEAVRRIGAGNPKRGADKLYALMDKAHQARKKAKRGQDTKLRKGLA